MAMFISGSSTSTGSFGSLYLGPQNSFPERVDLWVKNALGATAIIVGDGSADKSILKLGTSHGRHWSFIALPYNTNSNSAYDLRIGYTADNPTDTNELSGSIIFTDYKNVSFKNPSAKQAQFSGWSSDNNEESSNSGEILIGTDSFGTRIQFAPSTGGDNIRRTYIDNTYDAAAAEMRFRMRTSGTDVDAMTILGSGKVGIGATAPPFQKLTVTGTSATADAIFENGILAITTGTGV